MYNYDYDYAELDNIEGLIIGKALIKLRLQRQLRVTEDVDKKQKIRDILKGVNADLRQLQDINREYEFGLWG